MSEERVSRRRWISIAGGVVAGLVAGGVVGYLSAPKEAAPAKTVPGPGVTTTVTKTVTPEPTTYTYPSELRTAMWECYYMDPEVTSFKEKYGATVKGWWFDANAECYSKLKAGGWRDLDMVMGDGYWPGLYGKEELCVPIDYSRLENIDPIFEDLKPPRYPSYICQEGKYKGEFMAVPNCWGGYGITTHMDYWPEKEVSLGMVYEPPEELRGHVAISNRSQENIASCAVYLNKKYNWGLKDPWHLTDEQLEAVKETLIAQKPYLMGRWMSVSELAKWFEEGTCWISGDWFDGYGLAREAGVNVKYTLFPTEGGLGWIDGWCITKGADPEKDPDRYDLCHRWIDHMTTVEAELDLMYVTGHQVCSDIRHYMRSELDIEEYNMSRTHKVWELFMFEQPDRPGKWEEIWSEVLA